jgi:ribosomal protein S18 acetylase RimI-like enzyme
MIIRQATTDDSLSIAKVHVASWQCAYKGILSEDYLCKLNVDISNNNFKKAISQNVETFFVAESNDTIIGFCAIGPTRDPIDNERITAEIYALYLFPEFFGKGIGKLLLENAEKYFYQKEHSQFVLWVLEKNEQARKFYEKSGFITDGSSQIFNYGSPATALYYKKIFTECPTNK